MSSEEICDRNVLIDSEPNDAGKEMLGSGVVSETVNDTTNLEKVQKDFDPDFIEERFRVDRRKLEELIRADENGLCAEEFFSKIMKESDVYIAWPSKLKIGAKSKKDPYVKVSGKNGCVADAKNKILSNLTTKSLRVTLKMNVSHTEHSHVIGKGGNNIKKVMMETACHIHFPDSNRNNNNTVEKSSQVSVAGLFPAVEIARVKIRELLPLVLAFDVPVLCPGQLNVELLSLVESVQQKYGVSVSVKPHTVQSYLMSIHIRTSVFNSESAMKAADIIFEHMTGRSGVAYGVSLVMDLSAQHQAAFSSGAGIHLNQIMQWTGTTIHIPDQFLPNHMTLTPAGSFHALGKRKNAIYINGTMPNVFIARQQLLDYLPIVLMFDCDEDIVINPVEISKLSEELDVQVVVKLKPKHPSKSVIIKSVERNVEKLYEARRRILNLEETLETMNYDASKNYSSLGYLQQSPYKVGVEGMVVLPSNPTRPSASLANYTIPHNSIIRPIVVLPSSQAQGQPYGSTQPFYYSASPPPPPPHLLRHRVGGSSSVSPSSFCSYVSPTEVQSCYSTGDRKTSGTSPQLSPLKTASVSVKNHLFNKTNHFHSDANTGSMSDVNTGNSSEHVQHGLHSSSTKNNNDDDVNNSLRITPYNGIFEFQKNLRNPEHLSDDFGVSVGFRGSSRYGPLTINGDNHKHLISETGFSREGDLESSSSSSHESSLNHSSSSMGSIGSNKAPGSNRPKKSINSSVNKDNDDIIISDINADIDYIKLKNLANQAMQKKPDGECRFPTDYWSGLGFSKSMPQSAITEKLNQFNHLRYEGPSVPAQFEVANEDSDDTWTPGFNRLHQEELNNSKTIISLVNHLSGMSMAQREVFGSNDSPQWLDQEPLSDLDPLFNEIGLSKYINIFKQQEIDMATFLTLTDQDLKDLGINTLGARRKMLLVIEDLNRKQSVLPPPPGIPHPFRDPNFLKRRDIISHSIRW